MARLPCRNPLFVEPAVFTETRPLSADPRVIVAGELADCASRTPRNRKSGVGLESDSCRGRRADAVPALLGAWRQTLRAALCRISESHFGKTVM
jgi:hypothetical protein